MMTHIRRVYVNTACVRVYSLVHTPERMRYLPIHCVNTYPHLPAYPNPRPLHVHIPTIYQCPYNRKPTTLACAIRLVAGIRSIPYSIPYEPQTRADRLDSQLTLYLCRRCVGYARPNPDHLRLGL